MDDLQGAVTLRPRAGVAPLAAMPIGSRTLLALCGLLSVAACDRPESPPAPADPPTAREPEGMPTLEASAVDVLEGVVQELQPAGHYTYVRVGDPGAWAVVMGRLEVERGDAITLRVQGSKDDFHSRRLGRDFERLFFASVPKRLNPKEAT